MLTEICGKGGKVCGEAKKGNLRCPLIVRPTSEDVMTGHMFQVLRALNPRWWLPDLLNLALRARRFRRQVYRNLQIDLWMNFPRYPRELLPWDEGSTQVDVVIRWENPPTTVFVEMKYLADLSPRTTRGDGSQGFPSDQLIRNARVGLLDCGWFRREELLSTSPRDFVLVVVGPTRGNELVQEYRNQEQLLAAIPHSDRLQGLPASPFLGELALADVVHVLRRQRGWFTAPERRMADDLVDYLVYKTQSIHDHRGLPTSTAEAS